MFREGDAVESGVEVVSAEARPEVAHQLRIGGAHHVTIADRFVTADPMGAEWTSGRVLSFLDGITTRQPRREMEDEELVSAFYGMSPTLRRWRAQIPSASALHPLYLPTGTLTDGFPIDRVAAKFYTHALDGRGIRSRGATLSWLVSEYFGSVAAGMWASLACGAALSVSTALVKCRDSRLVVLDRDRAALGLARETAAELGIADRVAVREVNVLRQADLHSIVAPESCSVVECLGFFEYLSDVPKPGRVDAAEFLRLAFSLVRPGGVLLFANMLDSHPQLPFTLHVVRWPLIQPRSLIRLMAILDQAGIDRSRVETWLPGDGVYAVMSVVK